MRKSTSDIAQRLQKAGLKSPKEVTLSITNRCNLSCGHCWPNSIASKSVPFVPKEKVLKLIEEFSDLGVNKIIITGGEPLLHPHVYDFLSFASSQPNVAETRLQTNGTLINSSHVEALYSLKDQGLIIQVSVDGSTPSTHDKVRGKGSFERMMQGVELLIKGGMGHLICIAFTEMQHNFKDIPNLLEMCDEMSVKQFITATLVSGGRAKASNSLQPPSPVQYHSLLTQFKTDSVFRNRYDCIGNIAALEWLNETGNAEDSRCELLEMPYVNEDGKMYPCCMLQADEFAAIDVHNRPLQTAVYDKIELWSQLVEINRLRQTKLDTCEKCPAYIKCKAGCIGRAYTTHGDLMTVEDRCSHRKAVYQRQSEELF